MPCSGLSCPFRGHLGDGVKWDRVRPGCGATCGRVFVHHSPSVSHQPFNFSQWHLRNAAHGDIIVKALTKKVLPFLAHPAFFSMAVHDDRWMKPNVPSLKQETPG